MFDVFPTAIAVLTSGAKPQKLYSSDYAKGKERIDVSRILKDVSFGFESSRLTIPVVDTASSESKVLEIAVLVASKDVGNGIEIINIARTFSDSAFGIDKGRLIFELLDSASSKDKLVQLSAGLSVFDHSHAIDTRLSPQFFTVHEEPLGSETISGIRKPIIDVGLGKETAFTGYLTKDKSTGVEKIIHISRVVKEAGKGKSEVISPKPVSVLDLSTSSELIIPTYKEMIFADQTFAQETVHSRETSLREIGASIEKGSIVLEVLDTASLIEKIIFRKIVKVDTATSIESRLSPIPLKATELALGLEAEILDKELVVLDAGTGLSTRYIKIPFDAPPQSINITLERTLISDFYYSCKCVSDLICRCRIASSTQRAKAIILIYCINLLLKLKQIISNSIRKLIKHIINSDARIETFNNEVAFLIKTLYHIEMEINYTIARHEAIKTDSHLSVPLKLETNISERKKTKIYEWDKFKHYLERRTFEVQHLTKTTTEKINSDRSILVYSDLYRSLLLQDNTLYTSVTTKMYDNIFDTTLIKESVLTTSMCKKYLRDLLLVETPSTLRSLLELRKDIKDLIRFLTASDVISSIHFSKIFVPKETLSTTHPLFMGSSLDIEEKVKATTLEESFIRGYLYAIYRITEAYLKLLDLMLEVKKLQKVSYGDPVLIEHINAFYNIFKVFVEFAETLYRDVFPDDKDIEFYLNRLKDALSKFKRVWIFAIVRARDRNQIVELIYRARDFLEAVWRKIRSE